MIRQPIISVLGHVDHGKTSLLDYIRGTAVASREAGGITQHIGATEVPIDTVKTICGKDFEKWGIKLPGLLFIDTPGHKAFTNLRSRGGSLSDLAVLIVDINEGLQPQTLESINILKNYKTPFVMALNKIDRINGFNIIPKSSFGNVISKQNDSVKSQLDQKIWDFQAKMYEQGFDCDLYNKISDYTKKIAMVPVSAKTGMGVSDLLLLIAGLSQKFLKDKLEIDENDPGKCTILEVKEEKGLGMTLDVIVYDGVVKKKDNVVFGGKDGVYVTSVRALLKPKPLDEIRDPRKKFDSVESQYAAAGIKISAPDLEKALAGSPLYVATDIEKTKNEISKEIKSIKIESNISGVVVKTDTLGSLEAIVMELKELGIGIRRADIGDVTKQDIIEAKSVKTEDKVTAVVFAFNSKVLPDAREVATKEEIKLFESDIIYKLIEDYEAWKKEEVEKEKKRKFEGIIRPGKIELMHHHVFRVTKPAIVGIKVLRGRVKTDVSLLKEDGKNIGTVKTLKDKNDFLKEALQGKEIACAIDGPTVGRQIKEGDILYVNIPLPDYKKLKFEIYNELTEDEKEVLEEFIVIKRKEDSLWGI
ncbi:MAG: putative translation initiation factor IF-2 [Candidatus Methanofastidiosum methylothiophilum]|uniref:Probable translation initiation factor IF-2 n=1 Tax=Candidatus Methanofastidiosum methylothiophilum TaxID=1705564 RepID=A0A150J4V5_9EURY|nr:MAG: putative translation initiation factor IF-2 [Candidatus Methanofastidiosum methylthiophilus]